MSQFTYECEKICRNSCATLTRALQLETSIVKMTEEAIQQCDDADMKFFLTGLAEASSKSVLMILQKLNEIKARSEIFDGISSSFDSSENPA